MLVMALHLAYTWELITRPLAHATATVQAILVSKDSLTRPHFASFKFNSKVHTVSMLIVLAQLSRVCA